MCFVRQVMLCAVSAVFLALVSPGFGLDLKYYKSLHSETQRHVCEDAVRENPDLAKRLQATAERCVKQIQSELTALAKNHPLLAGIEKVQIEVPGSKETGKVLCGLTFQKSTRGTEAANGWFPNPSDKNGCVLIVWVRNLLASSPPECRYDFSDSCLAHALEIRVNYLLKLSEENKNLDKIVRALLDQRVKEMCDGIRKLQKAEDKPVLSLKYYRYLGGLKTDWDVCQEAAKANPDVVKQMQATAERHLKQIQTELAALAKHHPCLAGVGQAQTESRGAKETEKVLCGLSFQKSTHMFEAPSAVVPLPNKDGCVLYVWVHNILADRPPERSSDHSDWFLVHEIEIHAVYLLRLSKENKDLDKTVRALIDERVKEMCVEMKKLQTAEDKTADIN